MDSPVADDSLVFLLQISSFLNDVFSKTPDVRAALKIMALNLLAFVTLRLGVIAKAGAGRN